MGNPYLPFAFARNGTKATISETRNDGIVNLNQGYGDDYARQLGVDPAAKAIEREGQNWLFGVITENIVEWQLGAFPLYLEQRTYALGAFVRYTSGDANAAKVYRCIAVPPAGTLPTNTTYWEEVLTSAQIRALAPMPYRGPVSVPADFNTFDTNGTWTLDNATAVNSSPNAPGSSGAGMLECRRIGESAVSVLQRYTSLAGGLFIRQRNSSGQWSAWQTSTFPTPISQGGTGATTEAQARINLGLGTAAVRDIGASGANVPLLSGLNSWSGEQTFRSSGGNRFQGFGGADNYGRIYLGSGAAFLEYDGNKFAVGNPANGEYTILGGGGTTWTSGNLNPVKKSGDTMTGALNVNAGLYAYTALFQPGGAGTQIRMFRSGDGVVTMDAVNAAGSQSAPLRYVMNGESPLHITFNSGGQGIPTVYVWGGGGSGDNICSITRNGSSSYSLNWLGNATINGNLTVTGNINKSTGSSRKLKDIEGALPYGLNEICAIETAIGRYKKDFCEDNARRLFVIAEQLKPIIPEVVKDGAIEYNGERVAAVDYEMLIPVLINAIAELNAKVESLSKRND